MGTTESQNLRNENFDRRRFSSPRSKPTIQIEHKLESRPEERQKFIDSQGIELSFNLVNMSGTASSVESRDLTSETMNSESTQTPRERFSDSAAGKSYESDAVKVKNSNEEIKMKIPYLKLPTKKSRDSLLQNNAKNNSPNSEYSSEKSKESPKESFLKSINLSRHSPKSSPKGSPKSSPQASPKASFTSSSAHSRALSNSQKMDEYICSETNKLMIDKIIKYTKNPFDRPILFQYYAQFKKKRIVFKNLDKSVKFWSVAPQNTDWEPSEVAAFISISLYNCSKEYTFPLSEICEDINTSARAGVYKLANHSLWNYMIYDEIKSEYQIKRITVRILEILEFLHLNGIVDLDCFNIHNIYLSDDCPIEDIPNTLKLNLLEALEERERELTMIPPEKFVLENTPISEMSFIGHENRSFKTDLYRVGVIVFMLLFKKDPFDGLQKYAFVDMISKSDFTIDFHQLDMSGISTTAIDFLTNLLCPINRRFSLGQIKSHKWLGLVYCSHEEFLSLTKESDNLLKTLPTDVLHYLMGELIFYQEPNIQLLSDDMRDLIVKVYSEMRHQLAKNSHT